MTPANLTRGWTISQLSAAFDRVKDRDDWRAPIKATLGPDAEGELDLIAYAIEFFTATTALVTKKLDDEGNLVSITVEADGYRAGPAGP